MLAVGKVKPPYADDVAHYERLLRKQARVDVIEVADDDAIARRIPERAYVSLLDDRGTAYGSSFAQSLAGFWSLETESALAPFRTQVSSGSAGWQTTLTFFTEPVGMSPRLW